MAAFVFDNPAIGECSLMGDDGCGATQYHSRSQLCDGYLRWGWNYTGVSVFQKLRFMEHLRTLPYIDQGRVAVSSHSLGTETAIAFGLLCKDIRGIVFNDGLIDEI